MPKRPRSLTSNKLKARVLELLGTDRYQPLDKVALSRKLGLSSDDRHLVRRVLDELEAEGAIARIKKDRYVLPDAAGLFPGRITFHEKGFAFVENEQGGQDLFIPAENTATAMHGDRVLARITHEGIEEVAHRRPRGRKGQREDRAEGRVIRILKRTNPTIVGTLHRSRHFHYVVADEPRIVENIVVNPREAESDQKPRENDKVVVRLDPWESRHRSPEGVITEVLGPADAPGVDMEAIIRKFHLPMEFPDPVLRQAEEVPLQIKPPELKHRLDCRDELIFTIDPVDARDFDDAISVVKTWQGWKLQVHIADVSHYIRPGSALDKEAYKRGNSTYLVDRVIPMLPERLSNGICSLVPNEDRLTACVRIDFDKQGNPGKTTFDRAVICSKKRLSYEQALEILEAKPKTNVEKAVHAAWKLASLLRKRRFKTGALELDMPEVKVWLREDGTPDRLVKSENDISHQLIEEFMLAANEAVAKAIQTHPTRGIFRVHDQPDDDRLAEYRQVALTYGYKVGDLNQRSEVQKLLRASRGKPEENIIRIGLLKSLKRACYDVNPIGHYGLAKTYYTHFTSPIRRYADLVVHRIIFGIVANKHQAKPKKLAPADLDECAIHISSTERESADAEKESVKLKKLEYLEMQTKSKKRQKFPAGVIDVKSYGLLVELPDYLLTGLVHVSELRDDFYTFDATRLAFVGRKKKKVYAIGDELELEVSKVDMIKRQVDFRPANLGRHG